MGWCPLLNCVKNSYTISKFVSMAVKSGPPGDNPETFMPVFSADAIGFLVAM